MRTFRFRAAGHRGCDTGLRSQSLGRSARPAVSAALLMYSRVRASSAPSTIMGRPGPNSKEGEKVDLVYSRFSHPNAEIWRIKCPLETGAVPARRD